jgi:hypothetical protein
MVLLSRPRGRTAHSLISVMIEPNKAIGEAKRQSATFKAMRCSKVILKLPPRHG